MRTIVTSVGPLASASATNIKTAGAISGAGAVTLNGSLVSGGVATLDKPRRVLFTFASDETGKTYVVTGTNWTNQTISETVTGTTPGTVATVLDYKTVTSVVADAASAGNVSIGTNTVAGTPWIAIDAWALPNVALQCTASGTVNFTVQSTLDDPNNPTNPVVPASMTWVNTNDTAAVGATGSLQTNYFFAPAYVRVLLNSGSGSVTLTATQSGVVNE